MAAIMGGDADKVRALCQEAAEGEVVAPANFNAPGQIVIAGTAEAVGRASALADKYKLKAIPLKVSAPFHCALMEPAVRAMQPALSEIRFGAMAFPVISNVEAKPNADPARIGELLLRQIDGAVLWEQTVQHMADHGVRRALEIGPGKVLAGLVKRIDKRVSVFAAGDPESIARVADQLSSPPSVG
jgi:[acyl-carrier-protein] S-malonyltransferase